ncbi:unnamed protein product, partial [Mesorhabditis belari]|uniref:Uncharacterized protein n=1 Tax=Mesorhabditis belari TaxID=2138241 RepID=A0AAF3EY55_9BILA
MSLTRIPPNATFERRRSSIHLDPLSIRLPGSADIFENFPEKLNVSDKSNDSSRSASTSDDSSPESPHHPNLAPVKPPPSRLPSKNESRNRATSSDNTHNDRQRNSSLIAHLFEDTPLANRSRRQRRISVSDDFETTAQFIENLRQDLMKQL